MNGKNKRWLEQRWDMNQPERLYRVFDADMNVVYAR